jgi:aconitate hydratase
LPLSLSALDDVVTAEELSTIVVGFCDSVQPVRHSITADNNIKTVFAFMLFTALFSLITQLLYNIRFAVSSKDIVRNENLYSKLTYTMQKHALKRYKIKQMFIFTLTKIAICYKILISVIFERIVVTMGLTLTEKILKAHLVDGEFVKGQEIGIRIDQTLTQDATGTMAYLEYEAMGVPRVRTEKSVAYIDHNTLQSGFENADDHRFIGSVCKKHGIYFSRPGNGICHQVHLERFGIPGKTLIGSDSHTPTGGGIGMIAIGAGGLDVAVAMGGGAYYITYPKIVKVNLTGKLSPWVSAKDVILEVLRRMSVKGGVGKVIEYCGEGVKTLTVPERATITNMGAELGATTSIFPSDETTLAFLKAQDRADVWSELKADDDAVYDEQIDIDLSQLVPLAACPHSPDNVKSVNEIGKLKIDQVCIGSCTNSSYVDMMKVAHILKGKTVDPSVSLAIAPGSKQVLNMIAENGALADMIAAGARILESACGPCIGMGQSPNSKGVSLRTFNRNFEGRSGTKDGQIYLVSPEMAAVSALTGYLTDPRTLGDMPEFKLPEHFKINDNMVVPPADEADMDSVEVLRGPNIKPFPQTSPLDDSIDCQVSLKVGDNITTDHIMPAGAKILPLRSNIPAISQHCFTVCDEDFPRRAKNMGKSIIVGGSNYGQGSSREHAALAPLYLGIKAVLVKSFARIHRANLINAGILPLTFVNEADYDKINQGDEIVLADVRADVEADMSKLTVVNKTTGVEIPVLCELTGRTKDIILAGGLLDYTREQLSK